MEYLNHQYLGTENLENQIDYLKRNIDRLERRLDKCDEKIIHTRYITYSIGFLCISFLFLRSINIEIIYKESAAEALGNLAAEVASDVIKK